MATKSSTTTVLDKQQTTDESTAEGTTISGNDDNLKNKKTSPCWTENVKACMDDDRLLDASRIIREALSDSKQTEDDNSILESEHYKILRHAEEFEHAISELLRPADSTWTKQGESHGKYDTAIYYRVDRENGGRLSCRLETPIESSLLIPLLSVLNEVELYKTWVPTWKKFPMKMGIERTQRLIQSSRADQTFQAIVHVPWPFRPREAIVRAVAIDDIRTQGSIAVRVTGSSDHDQATEGDDGIIPPLVDGITRIDVDGAMLFRSCPPDHHLLVHSKNKFNEPVVLVSYKLFADPKMMGVPNSVLNFITRTAIGYIWSMLLRVAHDVKTGKRPEHKAVIEERSEMYDVFQKKVDYMIQQMSSQQQGLNEKGGSHMGNDPQFVSYLQG